MNRPPSKRRDAAADAATVKTSRPAHGNLALAEMLGMLSHEMRAPLQTLSASLDNVELELGDVRSPLVRMHLDRMRTALDKATLRLNSLSDYARTANRLSHQAVRVDDVVLRPYLEDVAAEHLTADAGRVGVDVAADVPPSLCLDKSRLQQILDNYLVNASKYGASGDLRIVVQRVGSGAAGRRREAVEFAVIDRGSGIPDDEVPLIWQPFYRLGNAMDKPGSGLGLAIVQLLCDSAGWEAGYRRVEHAGSCFYVRVPLIAARRRPGRLRPSPAA